LPYYFVEILKSIKNRFQQIKKKDYTPKIKKKCTYLGQVVFARFARKKGGEVVHFSALPKNEPHSPLFCERSEQKRL
jgi:hypothetical protein